MPRTSKADAPIELDEPVIEGRYVDLGGWVGGQAEYVMVPYADWNLLKFPDKAQALEKIRDLTCLSDILPTGYHGCVSAGVTTGSTVLISGAGPVGLAAAASAFLLGAAVVIIADLNTARLAEKVWPGYDHGSFWERMEQGALVDCCQRVNMKELQTFFRKNSKHPFQDDHLFISRILALGLKRCDVIHTDVTRRVSDHIPLFIELNS